ncbi:Reticulon, putative [Hepatocystis sp. ex Piliocolobus tephrosceles]|nr:Reticulon, putative [Hepatocystis sp. ex Piliocolobus tephrosceles]
MAMSSQSIVNLSLFSSINALYILLYVLNHTFLQVLCTLSILLLLLSGLLVFLKVHNITEYKENEKLEFISKELIEGFVTSVYEFINDKLTLIRRYLLWTNKIENITIIVIIYLFGNLFSFINFSALFYLITWIIFLYNHISNVYLTKIYHVLQPFLADLKTQLDCLYENIPKLKHIKKTI